MSSLNLKIIILIIVLLVLGAGVGFLAYNLFTTKLPTTNENTNKPFVNQPVNQVVEDQNQNINVDSYSADNKLYKKAVDERDPKYCDQTIEMKKDDCLHDVAIYLGVEVCQQISDAAIKAKCLAYHATTKALGDKNLKACMAISDLEFRMSCMVQLFIQQNDLNYCTDLSGEDKNLCEDLINKNIAIKATDANACANIQDQNIKDDCANIVSKLPLDQDNDGITDDLEKLYGLNPFKVDTDDDGLSDYDELYKYKTNPTKPDSDGDGYNDGEEVNSGHNPLGE